MSEQGRVVGGDFSRPRLRRFQQSIARTQGPLITPQGRPIKRLDLRTNEIKIAPPGLRTPAHEFNVDVRKRNHSSETQIFSKRVLFDLIEFNFSAQPAVAKPEGVTIAMGR